MPLAPAAAALVTESVHTKHTSSIPTQIQVLARDSVHLQLPVDLSAPVIQLGRININWLNPLRSSHENLPTSPHLAGQTYLSSAVPLTSHKPSPKISLPYPTTKMTCFQCTPSKCPPWRFGPRLRGLHLLFEDEQAWEGAVVQALPLKLTVTMENLPKKVPIFSSTLRPLLRQRITPPATARSTIT